MYATVCVRDMVPRTGHLAGSPVGIRPVHPTEEELGMRNRLRLPALAFIAVLLLAACSGGAAPSEPAAPADSAAPPASEPAEQPSESAAAAAPTPEPAADCAQSADESAMQMWERSGGNKGMV